MRLDDAHWAKLHGGYRVPYDPRPALLKLHSSAESSDAWAELWNELHHQGDVGEASYAAVPELVRIQRDQNKADWNTFALVATIELAREEHGNPPIPSWLENDYMRSLQELAQLGAGQLEAACDPELIRSVFSIIAIAKGLRILGRMLMLYSDDEWLEMERRLLG